MELLSAFSVAAVCQDSRLLLSLKFPLSVTLVWLKSILWSLFQACCATFDPIFKHQPENYFKIYDFMPGCNASIFKCINLLTCSKSILIHAMIYETFKGA